MNDLSRRLRYLLHRRRFDRELANDMEFHREMAALEGGRPLGNTLHLREEAREAWGWTWMERFSQDLRYAARMMRKSPGCTVAAVLILAIGIGVNVAAFGFFNLMVLRAMPVRDPGTLPRFQRFSGLSVDNPDVWLPITQQPYFVDGSKLLTDFSVEGSGVAVWGRLQAGLAPKAAENELRSLAAALRPRHPNDIWENESLPSRPGGYVTSTISGSHHGTGAKDPDLMVSLAAMIGALVLLILAAACGNLGSLLLARGVAREREIAIRIAAVGAGKGRLFVNCSPKASCWVSWDRRRGWAWATLSCGA